MTARELLKRAASVVRGDRQRDYGHPRDNHGCTAAMWNAYVNRRFQATGKAVLDAQDVCMLNILQKVSRYAHRRTDDTKVDLIGYTLNTEMVEEGGGK